MGAVDDLAQGVDAADDRLQLRHSLLSQEIHLIEEDVVCNLNLLDQQVHHGSKKRLVTSQVGPRC